MDTNEQYLESLQDMVKLCEAYHELSETIVVLIDSTTRAIEKANALELENKDLRNRIDIQQKNMGILQRENVDLKRKKWKLW
jgi:regulator of replication initiation timing